jgi:hypothetical protein
LPTLHLAEVTIRNFALKRLIAKYGKHWYNNSTLLDYRLSKKLAGELREAAQRELDLGRRGNLSDYITSELTFGFWVNVLTKTFQPDLWHAPLHSVLPGFPRGKTIVDLHDGVEFVRTFRNNVAHHKNIVFKPVVENYERTLEVTGLICGSVQGDGREPFDLPGHLGRRASSDCQTEGRRGVVTVLAIAGQSRRRGLSHRKAGYRGRA